MFRFFLRANWIVMFLHSSDKKLKRDGKPKKARQEDHLKHIPFRLREIMKSKERMKTGSFKAKKLKESEWQLLKTWICL